MKAKEALSKTKQAQVRKKRELQQKYLDREQARKEAYQKGRNDYKKHLLVVRKAISKATSDGERSVEVNVATPFTETDRKNGLTDKFYCGVQDKVGEILVADGYKVETVQGVEVDHPCGSDPMFHNTMYWLRALVKVSW